MKRTTHKPASSSLTRAQIAATSCSLHPCWELVKASRAGREGAKFCEAVGGLDLAPHTISDSDAARIFKAAKKLTGEPLLEHLSFTRSGDHSRISA